jgi:hypothetical protein
MVPPALYRDPNWALLIEVSKQFDLSLGAGRNVPGATYLNCGGVKLTLTPPQQDQTPRSA